MLFWLIKLFMVAVVFDGVIMIALFQMPGAVQTLLKFWRDEFILLILGVYALWTLRAGRVQLATPRGLIVTWVLIMAIGFLGVLVGRARGTVDPAQTIALLRMVYMFALLFGVLVMPPRQVPQGMEKGLFGWLGAALVIAVAAGCVQWLRPEAWMGNAWVSRAADEGVIEVQTIEGYLRPAGTLGSTMQFGDFCAVMLVLTLTWVLFQRKRRLVVGFLFLLSALGLAMSTVRSAMMVGAVGMAYVTIVRLRVMRGAAFRVALGTVLALVAITVPFVMGQMKEQKPRSVSISGAYMSSDSLDDRFENWNKAWQRVESSADFLFGLGTGAVGGARRGLGDRQGVFEFNPVDNYYLLVLVNHGLIGVVIWGAFVLQLLWLLTRASLARTESQWFLNAAVAVLLGYFVDGMFRIQLRTTFDAAAFWVLMGIAAVRAREVLREREPITSNASVPAPTDTAVLPGGA